ncbi:MAG: hypothetical protein KC468_25655 [Myxococcales bacterium]|nr:hypothetical protein [Myxococcales bacterium]
MNDEYEVIDVVSGGDTPIGRLRATNDEGAELSLEAPSGWLRQFKVGDIITATFIKKGASPLERLFAK